MIALATAAFGVIAALAWNTAITDLFKAYLPGGSGIVADFIYAILVTIIAVIVIVNLGNVAQRLGAESSIK
jgi:hypothetical protein